MSPAEVHSVPEPTVQPSKPRFRWRPAIFFGIALVGYALAAHYRPIMHREYLYLADAFFQGSLSVSHPPAEFIDLVHVGTRHYLPYGVMPALLLLPLVALFGTGSAVQAVTLVVLGAATVTLTYRLLQRVNLAESTRVWVTVLFAFGTSNLFASAWGGPWFLMHLVGILFLLLALNEMMGRGRWFLVGIWFGCAVLSRNPILLATPVFLVFLLREQNRWSRALDFAAGLIPCLMFSMWYNLVRFDNPTDNGYGRVLLEQPHGMFSVAYLRRNIQTYFLALPEWLGRFPWLRPSPQGVSLFLATPAFVYAFRAPLYDRLVLASWLVVVGMGSLYLVYFWGGYAQFGPRYLMDSLPFLILPTAVGLRGGVTRLARWLIILSIATHVWGLAWWRFGRLLEP